MPLQAKNGLSFQKEFYTSCSDGTISILVVDLPANERSQICVSTPFQMNEQTFEQLFKNNFTYLSRVALAIVKDEDTACDIVQHVFVRLWHNRGKIKINSSERAYLHRSVINTALNFSSRHKKTELRDHFSDQDMASNTFDYIQTSDAESSTNELLQQLHWAQEQLPPKCRLVFALSRQSGLSNKEIAKELDISVKAVEKHISKALRFLREKLAPMLMVVLFWFENKFF
ncbi:MAG: RNA polymerase sigma-70 factor [Bacteroidota bacterium]